MKTVNRREIARVISEKTGYFVQDIESILDMEEEVVLEFLKEQDTEKVKLGKMLQIDIFERPSKKAWDGIHKEYIQLEPRIAIKPKVLKRINELVKERNKEK